MAAKKKSPEDLSETAADGDAKPVHALVDYDGIIAKAPGQDEIRHVDSPLTYQWPEPGVVELVLQPGLNVLPLEHWRTYGVLDRDGNPGEGKPQIAPMLRTGEIKVLDGLPKRESDLKDLIERSRCKRSLEWLRDEISANADDYFDSARYEDRAAVLLKLIDKRLSSSNFLAYEAAPFRVHVPTPGAPQRTAGLGMG